MKIDQSIFHPDYKREPFWWEAARPGTQYATDLPTQTEILIVGSGYAGLSAALELAREGRAVTVVGQEDGLHYCTGCNGSGVAMMPYLGWQVARRILQDGKTDCAYSKIKFPGVPVPFYRGKPWFLPVVGEYYRYLDRRDRRRGS